MSDENTVDATLEKLQQESFNYFLHETNPANGLVVDKNEANWPASIAATGLALASYPVAVERGFMPRPAAGRRTLNTLRFFWNSPQGPEPDATGYKGFYYHFLDAQSGRRVWQCEPSTGDSASLLAGALTAGIDKALLLYMLGLGSPTHAIPESSYAAWASTYRWEQCYGQEYRRATIFNNNARSTTRSNSPATPHAASESRQAKDGS